MNWIRNHFHRYRQRTPWDFCWRITIEGFLISLAVGIVLGFLDLADRDLDMSLPVFVLFAVVLAPLLETLVLQALPVWIARLAKARFSTQVIASLVPFCFAHLVEGIGTAIAAGLVGGFYFAFTYAHWRESSRWTAFWTTSLSHAMHNAAAITLAVVLGEIA